MIERRQAAPEDRRREGRVQFTQISLIRGGPFYRAQEATHLIDRNHWNLGRRIALAIAVGWLPLVLLTAIFQPSALGSLLSDYRVAARMLIAVPVLLIGQVLMESRFRTIVHHLREARILNPADQPRLDSLVASMQRLRDSFWPELILVGLVYANVVAATSSHLHEARPWALSGFGLSHTLAAGRYYVFVSQLVYQFLVALSLWKWFLWSYFAFRLSRLDMQLIPTHPDKHGGLGVIGSFSMAFAPVAFAAAIAIGANWRHQILTQGAHFTDYKVAAAVLLAIVLIAAFGPLAFFMPRLSRLRRRGLLDYGTLGQIHSTDFHRKWVLDPNRNEEEFLTAPEISTLIDYGSSYENIAKMQPLMADKGSLLMLTLAVLLPLMPVVLAEVPLGVVLQKLFEAVK